ncbi:MAG: (2Fe-2S)-binding protein, partial [Desulfurococcales archaeon]|nr:(2Fe-2S)-binding protein [Desulfurococcales archaeon]
MRFVCLCEEITYEEIEDVVKAEKIKDLETLKRRLRVGMGHCGGRYCLNLILRLYPKLFGESPRYRTAEELHIPTARPPVKPVPLKELVGWGGGNE